jgi:hypothetical protein
MSACALATSTGGSVKPMDLYAAGPTLADVRSLLGDSTWWPGPPSFGVRPLDSSSMPFQERFHVTHRFTHIGTGERLDIQFTAWSTTSAATTEMTNIQSALGTPVNGPKVGDQVLYYGSTGSGPAPFTTATFVRVGQVMATISLNLKDAFPSVSRLGKIASKVVSRLKDVLAGKIHVVAPTAADQVLLPPNGPDLTLLGTARLPVEVVLVMFDYSAPETLAQAFHNQGVDSVLFGDYALDNDTHMEVRAVQFSFLSTKDATAFENALRGSTTVDQNGIASLYSDSLGEYVTILTSGTRGALLICRSTSDTEAASRACEVPLSRVAPSWQLTLGG